MQKVLWLVLINLSFITVAAEDALESHKIDDQKQSKIARIIKPRSNR